MKKFLVLAVICFCLVNYTYTASKYYDGPIIPYKFGYSIENYQHRHEEKDEKGQIMGEFGFVTADGVYHLTGYGTDENGNYKILFMKNIKIGLPGEPGSQPAPQNIIAEEKKEIPVTITTLVPPSKSDFKIKTEESIPSDISSCSNCIIPKPKIKEPIRKEPESQLLPASFIRPDEKLSSTISKLEPAKTTQKQAAKQTSIAPNISSKKPTSVPTSNSVEEIPLDVRVSENISSKNKGNINVGNQVQLTNQISTVSKGTIRPGQDEISRGTLDRDNRKQITDRIDLDREILSNDIGKISNDIGKISGPKQIVNSNKPSSISDKQIFRGPGDEVRKKITSGILYKFNYTAGYHGHHEQGDEVGAKDGGYYFISRDGYKRTVDYSANELGFQPHVKLEQAEPDDIPREETEKEAGLKGYEFKWFNI